MLDLAGVLGVPLYTNIVDSGGDSRRRRNCSGVEPDVDSETLSLLVGGAIVDRSEDRALSLHHGDRARTGREQPYHGLPTLEGFAGSRKHRENLVFRVSVNSDVTSILHEHNQTLESYSLGGLMNS